MAARVRGIPSCKAYIDCRRYNKEISHYDMTQMFKQITKKMANICIKYDGQRIK